MLAFQLGFKFDEGIAQPASSGVALLADVAALQEPRVGQGQGPLANQHVDDFEG